MDIFFCGRSCMGNLKMILLKDFSCSWNAWNIEPGSTASYNKYVEPMLMKWYIWKGCNTLAFLIRHVSIKLFFSKGTSAQLYATHIFLQLEFKQDVLQLFWIGVLKWYPEYMLHRGLFEFWHYSFLTFQHIEWISFPTPQLLSIHLQSRAVVYSLPLFSFLFLFSS